MRDAVILTRPPGVNGEFAERLRMQFPDIVVIEAPLANYEAIEAQLQPLGEFDAAIVTSKAALDFLNQDPRQTHWLVVGDQAENALRRKGVEYIRKYERASFLKDDLLNTPYRKFLYLRGEDIRTELSIQARKNGQDFHESILYRLSDIQVEVEVVAKMREIDRLTIPVFSISAFDRIYDFLMRENFTKPFIFIPLSDRISRHIREKIIGLRQEIEVLDSPNQPKRESMIAEIGRSLGFEVKTL